VTVPELGVDPLGDAISWRRRRPDAHRALVLWEKDVADGVRPSMDTYGRLREHGIAFATREAGRLLDGGVLVWLLDIASPIVPAFAGLARIVGLRVRSEEIDDGRSVSDIERRVARRVY
jgi:hypothetical protein